LVTHGHLDHVTGLVLSAGAMQGVRKRVWATQETLKDLESGVFSDRLWPNLASWKESDPSFMLLYSAYVFYLVQDCES
jgi:cAMP phosphodiesterase